MNESLKNIKAMTFDVFGTVVDWRSSVSREVSKIIKRHVADLLVNSESITGERIYVIKEENDISKVELEGFSTIAFPRGIDKFSFVITEFHSFTLKVAVPDASL